MSTAPTPQLSCIHLSQRKDGGWVVGVIAKRSYRIEQIQGQGHCRLEAEQVPLVLAPQIDDSGQLLRDTEYMLQKRFTDLIISGYARCPRPCTRFEVGVSVGAHEQRYQITGPRMAYRNVQGKVTFTDPKPTDTVKMDWSLAYGGVDRISLKNYGDPTLILAQSLGLELPDTESMFCYTRNPLGKGFCVELKQEQMEGIELPQIEFAAQALTSETLVVPDPLLWPRAPQPASTLALPYTFFPRSNQTGFNVRDYERNTITPADFIEFQQGLVEQAALNPEAASLECMSSHGLSQSAAPGLRLEAVRPGAPVRIVHMHPEHPTWTFSLPTEGPKMGFRVANSELMQPKPMISSLWIEPDTNRLEVVWVAATNVAHAYTPAQLQKAEFGVRWD